MSTVRREKKVTVNLRDKITFAHSNEGFSFTDWAALSRLYFSKCHSKSGSLLFQYSEH